MCFASRVNRNVQPVGGKRGWLLVGMFLVLTAGVFALDPPTPQMVQQYQADGSWEERLAFAKALGNHRVAPELIERLNYNFQRSLLENEGWLPAEIDQFLAPPPPRYRGMPTKGNVKICVMLLEFQDIQHTTPNSAVNIRAQLLGDGIGGALPLDSLRNYYRRSSYNQLEIGGTVFDWYQTAYARSTIPTTEEGRENVIKEMLNYWNGQGHDFTQYDNDGDGYIDMFAVIWAGENAGWSSFWWAYQTSFGDTSYTIDGKKLKTYIWQYINQNYPTDDFNPRTFIHESGHALGLPDYYDYDQNPPIGGVGGASDIMDGGATDHNCFSKWLLDWINPAVKASGTQTVTQRPSVNYPDAVAIMPGMAAGDIFNEFYMVELRTPYANSNDNGLLGGGYCGFFIWHVDARLSGSGWDFRFNNSYTSHKLLRLMEADGLEQIEQGQPADTGDFYGGGYSALTPATTPSSNRYSRPPTAQATTPTGIVINGWGGNCDQASFQLSFGDTSAPTGAPGTPTDAGSSTTSWQGAFNWTLGSAADPDSGIAAMQLQIGTTPGGSDRFNDYVGPVTSYTLDNLENGKTYYARARAVNGSGVAGSWSGNSDGIIANLPTLAGSVVDNPGITLTTAGGTAPWASQTVVSYQGGSAARSGALSANGQNSVMYMTVTGPGTVSFVWKVSCEAGTSGLMFFVDDALGNDSCTITGELGWYSVTVPVTAGTHVLAWVYVRGTTAVGQDCGWVDTISYTTPGSAPAAPSGLTATAVSSSQINLAWVDNSSNETSFKIERKTGAAGTFAQIATVAANVGTYQNTGLAAGQPYVYRVRANNASGDSSYSAEASATTSSGPPLAPTNLTATVASATQVNLAWQDHSADESGFFVWRQANAGAWTQVGTLAANVVAFQNTGLVTGTPYCYAVRAYRGTDVSDASNTACATPSALPAAPTGLTATAISASQINLSWTDASSNESGFRIERKTGSGGTYAEIATVAANTSTYPNTGLAAGQPYYYRVRAYNAGGNSAYSNEANATTSSVSLPVAPSGLTAHRASNSQINLAWQDKSGNETGFRIERKTGAGGTYAEIATAGANAVLYANTGLAAGTTYFYRVRAYNGGGNSGYTNEASANSGDYDLYVAASAHNSTWRSDIDLLNMGATAASVRIALLKQGNNNTTPTTADFPVPAGQTVRISDILGSTFSAANAALGFRYLSGTVKANCRFYNIGTGAGTYGMGIAAADESQALCGDGANRGVFHHLGYSPSSNSGYRTNIGLANASSFSVTVVIKLYGDTGELQGTLTRSLQPFEQFQYTKIHETAGVTTVVNHGHATVEVQTVGGKIHAYAMTIDNKSQDPVYWPAEIIPR